MRQSSIDVLYVPTGIKKKRIRMLKSLSILEKMHPDDAAVFASNIIGKYQNRPGNHICCTEKISHPVMSAKRQIMCQESLMTPKATLFQYLMSMMLNLIQI